MTKNIFVGKRKKAIARCVYKEGKGNIYINSIPAYLLLNDMQRLFIMEPLFLITDNSWKRYDFFINVKGGGVSGQLQALRQSIARSLVSIYGKKVKNIFMRYDRNMLVYDPRRTEPHKPSRSSQGPRRRKQLSKR